MSNSGLDIEFEGVLADLQGYTDAEVREMIERSSRIQDMTNHPGWPMFKDYLVALTASHQRRILGGYCGSMEEYRRETGFVDGLQAALNAPKTLAEQVELVRRRLDDNVESDET